MGPPEIRFEFWGFMAPKIMMFKPEKWEYYHSHSKHKIRLKTKEGYYDLNFKLESSARRLILELDRGKTVFELDDTEEAELNEAESYKILDTYTTFNLAQQVALNVKAKLGLNLPASYICSLSPFSKWSEKEVLELLQYRRIRKFNPEWYKTLITPQSVQEKMIGRKVFFNYLKEKYENKHDVRLSID